MHFSFKKKPVFVALSICLMSMSGAALANTQKSTDSFLADVPTSSTAKQKAKKETTSVVKKQDPSTANSLVIGGDENLVRTNRRDSALEEKAAIDAQIELLKSQKELAALQNESGLEDLTKENASLQASLAQAKETIAELQSQIEDRDNQLAQAKSVNQKQATKQVKKDYVSFPDLMVQSTGGLSTGKRKADIILDGKIYLTKHAGETINGFVISSISDEGIVLTKGKAKKQYYISSAL